LALRSALAQTLNVSPQRILPGNGVSELVLLAVLAFLKPGNTVLIFAPTFAEYARTARLSATVSTCWANQTSGFKHTTEEIAAALQSRKPDLVFVCNPNNPTGALLRVATLAAWTRKFPRTRFVVDEAFLPFAACAESAMDLAAENVVVLRSMTKDYAL